MKTASRRAVAPVGATPKARALRPIVGTCGRRTWPNIGESKSSFYFRGPDDCPTASTIAADIAAESDYVRMKAARLISVKYIGRLLN